MTSLLRRAAAVAASALLGLSGLAGLASPASAADTGPVSVSATAACNTATGEWDIKWTLSNDRFTPVTVSNFKATPEPVPGLSGKFDLEKRLNSGIPSTRVFPQTLKGEPREATLSFSANWKDGSDLDNTFTVQLGDCKPAEVPCTPRADVKFAHTFAVKDGQATATVKVTGDAKLCQDEPVTLVSYYAPKPQFSVPQFEFAHRTATLTNETRAVELTTPLPNCNAQVDLFFGGEDDIIGEIVEGGPRYNDTKLGSSGGLGGRSEGPQAWYNGGSKACQTPAVEPVSSCDGTVVLHLSNTGELNKHYPVDFTVKAGTFTKTVTVKAGEGENVTVPAGSGTVTVTAENMADFTYDWTKPEDCPEPVVVATGTCTTVTVKVTNPEGAAALTGSVTYGDLTEPLAVEAGATATLSFSRDSSTEATVTIDGKGTSTVPVAFVDDCGEPGETPPATPTPGTTTPAPGDGGGEGGGGNDDGGSLPVTGAAAGTIAGVAVLLLVGGAVAFFVARRRKVKFTA